MSMTKLLAQMLRRKSCGLFLLMAMFLADCGQSSGSPRTTPTRPAATATTQNSTVGAVVGGIEPCDALGIRSGSRTRFAAGLVTVLRGVTRIKSLGHGVLQVVLPKTLVLRRNVKWNHRYHFELAPGRYVLKGRLLHANTRPFVRVRVRAHRTVVANIPNECM